MKTKVLFFLLTSCLLVVAAWLVHVPNPAQADEVPEKYRETVHKGLEFLVKNQHKDGHWEGDGGQHPVAMTGLAGIALLMDGDGYRRRTSSQKYSANIRKAVDWLMDNSPGRDGLIFSGHASETGRYMYGHGLATIFLAGALGHENGDRERRAKLYDVLNRAVKYIVSAESNQGGWYYTSKVEGHDFDVISATVIQIQALQAAEHAGIAISNEAVHDGREYLKTALAKYEEGARPGQKGDRRTETAAALAVRADYGEGKEGVHTKWFKYCQNEIPIGQGSQLGRDVLAHYYYAQAMFLEGHREHDLVAWNDYRTAMFDHLQSAQNKDGSWPAPLASQGGLSVGPVYATALWCTILQLDRNRHPATQYMEIMK